MDSLLREQLKSYVDLAEQSDSIDRIRVEQLTNCLNQINEDEEEINLLKKTNNRLSFFNNIKTWLIGLLTASTLVGIAL